jgi:tetratricopeptide (TPR) repeat protein
MGQVVSLLVQADKKAEATKVADAWATKRPGDPRGYLLQARARMLANQEKEALPYARRALEAQPDSLLPRILVARIHSDLKQYAEAEKVLNEGLERPVPAVVPLLLEIGGVREQRGDVAGAEAAARDALKREPKNPRAQNSLGYLLADQNRNLPEAEDLIRKAVAQDPDNGAYIDSMGWVHFRMGPARRREVGTRARRGAYRR